MILKYHLTVPRLPYGGTEAGAREPPIAVNRVCSFPNRFNNFLKRLTLDLRPRGPGPLGGSPNPTGQLRNNGLTNKT